MRRKARLGAIFALAIVLPACILAVLGFRAIRTEGMMRREQSADRARGAARLAATDLRRALDAWLESERARLTTDSPEVVAHLDAGMAEPVDLAASILRERPDLAEIVALAERRESVDPADAARLYLQLAGQLEHPPTSARLTARAARATRKAGDANAARTLYEGLVAADVVGESGAPIGASARLALLELGEDVGADLIKALPRDPAYRVFVLQRMAALGVAVDEPLDCARAALAAVAWARGGDGNRAWLRGGWAACIIDGRAVCLLRAHPAIDRLRDYSQLAPVVLGVRRADEWLSAPLARIDFEEPVIEGIAVAAELRAEETSRTGLVTFGGIVALLVVAMALGLLATVRAVDRELRVAQLKADFVSSVSHELRTPLTSVRVFSELLGRPELDDAKRREYADLIAREASRLSRLVERLLDFARLERGAQVLSFDRCDLRDVIERAVASFHPSRPFDVKFSPPAAPVRVCVDAEAMAQALHNLFDNAVKYAPGEREAEVTLRIEGDWARIDVRDRGAGVDPRDQPLLFEKFQRGRSAHVMQVPGTGLGLAIVRQILEAHRGRARLVSTPGTGTTFVLEVPLWRGS